MRIFPHSVVFLVILLNDSNVMPLWSFLEGFLVNVSTYTEVLDANFRTKFKSEEL